MKPSVGRIVHYKLAEGDVATIGGYPDASTKRNPVEAEQVYPAVIVRVWGADDDATVNLQVFLDGDCSYWAASRNQGDLPGQWSEPPRV